MSPKLKVIYLANKTDEVVENLTDLNAVCTFSGVKLPVNVSMPFVELKDANTPLGSELAISASPALKLVLIATRAMA